MLGLRCCTRTFSSCGERGLFFVAVRRLLTVVASLVAEHEFLGAGPQQFWPTGLISLWHVWDLPGPGIEPVSPALAGGLLSTMPLGKSIPFLFFTLPSLFSAFVPPALSSPSPAHNLEQRHFPNLSLSLFMGEMRMVGSTWEAPSGVSASVRRAGHTCPEGPVPLTSGMGRGGPQGLRRG